MIASLFTVIYIVAIAFLTILFFVMLWRAMRAHESIAESMKAIAQQMSAQSQT